MSLTSLAASPKRNTLRAEISKQIECILGFQSGRLARGVAVAAFLALPKIGEFELGAYSNVALHRHRQPAGLDPEKLKAEARASWMLAGFERLVKVLPVSRHDAALDPDAQYPPGSGAPQWIATAPIPAKVVAVVFGYPSERYIPASPLGAK